MPTEEEIELKADKYASDNFNLDEKSNNPYLVMLCKETAYYSYQQGYKDAINEMQH